MKQQSRLYPGNREKNANYLFDLREKLDELCGKKVKTTENTKNTQRTQSKREKLSDLVS